MYRYCVMLRVACGELFYEQNIGQIALVMAIIFGTPAADDLGAIELNVSEGPNLWATEPTSMTRTSVPHGEQAVRVRCGIN